VTPTPTPQVTPTPTPTPQPTPQQKKQLQKLQKSATPQQKKQLQNLQKSVTPQQKKQLQQLQKKSLTPQQQKKKLQQLQKSVTPQQKKQLQQLQKSVTPQQKKQLQQLQKKQAAPKKKKLPACVPGQASPPGGCIASDARLKRDIVPLATLANGIKLYSFRYLWSETMQVGVMAQDLLAEPSWREAVRLRPDGYYAVDYAGLGLRMATFADWQARGLASVVLEPAQDRLAPTPVAHAQRGGP
jgi:hypothetical protein